MTKERLIKDDYKQPFYSDVQWKPNHSINHVIKMIRLFNVDWHGNMTYVVSS